MLLLRLNGGCLKKFLDLITCTAIQVLAACAFSVFQMIEMITRENTRSVTVTWLIFAEIFVIINFIFSWRAYAEKANPKIKSALYVYFIYMVLIAPTIIVAIYRCELTVRDAWVSVFIVVSMIVFVVIRKMSGIKISNDAFSRGFLVGLLRVVPHLFQAYTMFLAKTIPGIHPITIVAANFTASVRALTLFQACRQENWNKKSATSFWAEFLNEASWLIVTFVWMYYRFRT